MKKNIIIAAVAALTLSLTACQKEDVNPVNPGQGAGEVNSPAVKTTADLIGTNWTYTMDDMVFADDMGDTLTIPGLGDLVFLAFDADYAHFTFSDAIEAWGVSADGMSMEQISGVDYEYSYDGTTHTGSLVGTVEDETGAEVTTTLQFTYDDDTDQITFSLPLSFDGENSTNVPIMFHRSTAE